MSEEKIWVEDDILITSLNTHENTNMAGEPNLSESGVTGSWRVSTRDDDDGNDGLTRSNRQKW